ncbi:MAG: ATP-binding cassette domain-containing protein [Candidatus Zixiibacteriota bacterium]
MSLLSAENLCKRYEERVALKDVSITINKSDHIALVGRNGAGKTTLLDIVAGLVNPESGAVHRSSRLSIDYVRQELGRYSDLSLREFVTQARGDILELEDALREIERALESDPHRESLVAKYDSVQRRFESAGGFEFQSEVDITLGALGFPRERWPGRLRSFSGGEQNRAALARALLGAGELLLLDEPTNHLDIESTEWLEKKLCGSSRAFVVVSHDRAFLTNIVDSVWDLAFGALDRYRGGFEYYVSESAGRRAQREREYQRQRDFIAKTEAFIRKNIAGQKTRQAQSRRKQLARLTRIDTPRSEEATSSMSARAGERSFSHALAIERVDIGYDSQALVANINLDLYRGERVALIGPNGSGKSTLIRTILGELEPLAGELRIGGRIEVGYFDQTLGNLDESLAVIEHLWNLDALADQGALRSYLARFGFYGDETLKPVCDLSGGEKTKLSLALLMYQPTNLLILDEPTNHLDMQSREALENALREYSGAALIASHDRYFLNQVTQKTFSIEDGGLHDYAGPYDYYVRKRRERELANAGAGARGESDYPKFKERSKKRARLEKKIGALSARITEQEAGLKALDNSLTCQIPKSDWEKLTETSARRSEVEMNLLELYQEREDLSCELERMNQASPERNK